MSDLAQRIYRLENGVREITDRMEKIRSVQTQIVQDAFVWANNADTTNSTVTPPVSPEIWGDAIIRIGLYDSCYGGGIPGVRCTITEFASDWVLEGYDESGNPILSDGYTGRYAVMTSDDNGIITATLRTIEEIFSGTRQFTYYFSFSSGIWNMPFTLSSKAFTAPGVYQYVLNPTPMTFPYCYSHGGVTRKINKNFTVLSASGSTTYISTNLRLRENITGDPITLTSLIMSGPVQKAYSLPSGTTTDCMGGTISSAGFTRVWDCDNDEVLTSGASQYSLGLYLYDGTIVLRHQIVLTSKWNRPVQFGGTVVPRTAPIISGMVYTQTTDLPPTVDFEYGSPLRLSYNLNDIPNADLIFPAGMSRTLVVTEQGSLG